MKDGSLKGYGVVFSSFSLDHCCLSRQRKRNRRIIPKLSTISVKKNYWNQTDYILLCQNKSLYLELTSRGLGNEGVNGIFGEYHDIHTIKYYFHYSGEETDAGSTKALMKVTVFEWWRKNPPQAVWPKNSHDKTLCYGTSLYIPQIVPLEPR